MTPRPSHAGLPRPAPPGAPAAAATPRRSLLPLLAAALCVVTGPSRAALNDTGVGALQCYDVGSHLLAACAGSSLTGQDGQLGRDAGSATNGNGNGALGFSFARVCHSGQQAGSGTCPAKPKLGSGANQWGCTLDKVTGLVWELKTASGPRAKTLNHTHYGPDWDPVGEYGSPTDAAGYVAQVNSAGLCGASDWRLPSVLELHSIAHLGGVPVVDSGDGLIAIDTAWFPNTIESAFWASDAFVLNITQTWMVDTGSGRSSNDARSAPRQVRLVRNSLAVPPQRYTVSPDGSEVQDALLGLVWRRCPEGLATLTAPCSGGSLLKLGLEAALQHAATQAQATGQAWRLPNAKELAAIADLGRSKPAIDPLAFPGTPQLKFWSSTPQVFSGGSSTVRVVDFYQGYLTPQSRAALNPLRLVRDAP